MRISFCAFTITVTRNNSKPKAVFPNCKKHDLLYDPFGDDADGTTGYYCRVCDRKFGPLNMPGDKESEGGEA
jgi:hypothetical protein